MVVFSGVTPSAEAKTAIVVDDRIAAVDALFDGGLPVELTPLLQLGIVLWVIEVKGSNASDRGLF